MLSSQFYFHFSKFKSFSFVHNSKKTFRWNGRRRRRRRRKKGSITEEKKGLVDDKLDELEIFRQYPFFGFMNGKEEIGSNEFRFYEV